MTDRRGRASRWLAVWLVLQGLAVSWGLWQGHRNDVRQHHLIGTEAREEQVEEARLCVRSWDAREDMRDMSEKVYRRISETLIELSSPDLDALAMYGRLADRDVAEIRSELPDPACELDAARALLDENG